MTANGAASVSGVTAVRVGPARRHVTHYGLELDVDPAAGQLRGTATITARATQDLSAFRSDPAGSMWRAPPSRGFRPP
ncbi:hypothetical protein EES46_00475 [Streptomyces sp. ADI98-10]|nr:hypothetical protein EES46_00475 [Streptomyces sp. ADI98-10]